MARDDPVQSIKNSPPAECPAADENLVFSSIVMRFSLLKTVFSDGIFLLNFTKIQLPVSVYEKLPPCFRISENKGGVFHKGGGSFS